MANIKEITEYLATLLDVANIEDYGPNGLQVEGKTEIHNLVTGVSACQELFAQAIERNADAVLVHHGLFWTGDDLCITGVKRRRISQLIKNDVNLLAYHLPLDIHPVYGNNAELAKLFNLEIEEKFCYGYIGKPKIAQTGLEFNRMIEDKLQREPFYIPGKSETIKRLAWCSGGSQKCIAQAIARECDAFLAGEVSENTYHLAKDAGIHFYAAGHHATERCGVKALGEHLAHKFALKHEFIDIENPV